MREIKQKIICFYKKEKSHSIGAGTEAIAGAALDFTIATGGVGGFVVAAVGSGVSSGLNSALTDVANGREVNWGNVMTDTATGAIGGMLSFCTGGGTFKKSRR